MFIRIIMLNCESVSFIVDVCISVHTASVQYEQFNMYCVSCMILKNCKPIDKPMHHIQPYFLE